MIQMTDTTDNNV